MVFRQGLPEPWPTVPRPLGVSLPRRHRRQLPCCHLPCTGHGGQKALAVIVASGGEAAALAPLPLSVLDLTEEQAGTFSLWGIHTLGMLAALPEKALIARMGQEGKRVRQLACGTLPHLFVPMEAAFALDEWMGA